MSWRTAIRRPGSFRGVAFEALRHDLEGGRRIVVDDYPKRDDPDTEDMGRLRRDVIVEGLVVGDDYLTRRDALVRALEQEGIGELDHPWLGRLQVRAESFTQSESHEEGGLARFRMSFVVARDLAGLQLVGDPAAAAASASQDAVAALPSATSTAADALYAPTYRRELNRLRELDWQEIADRAGVDPAEVVSDFDALDDLDALLALSERVSPYEAAALVLGPALRAWERWAAWFRRAALARAVVVASEADYGTAEEAEAVQSRLLTDLTVEIATAEGDELVALIDLRAAASNALTNRAEELPRLLTIEIEEVTPAVVVAYEVHGDGSRMEEILAQNAIADPGFVIGTVRVRSS